jgi:hypothetical protein
MTLYEKINKGEQQTFKKLSIDPGSIYAYAVRNKNVD